MWLWLSVVAAILLAAGLLIWRRARIFTRVIGVERGREMFRLQREHLEVQFFKAASATGKPRGLRWKECQWEDGVLYAREIQSHQLVALVGVTISFEAIPGSDMEDLPAVGNLRNATAVFFFANGQWATTGRAVFNMNPDEAVRHFGKQYEMIA